MFIVHIVHIVDIANIVHIVIKVYVVNIVPALHIVHIVNIVHSMHLVHIVHIVHIGFAWVHLGHFGVRRFTLVYLGWDIWGVVSGKGDQHKNRPGKNKLNELRGVQFFKKIFRKICNFFPPNLDP